MRSALLLILFVTGLYTGILFYSRFSSGDSTPSLSSTHKETERIQTQVPRAQARAPAAYEISTTVSSVPMMDHSLADEITRYKINSQQISMQADRLAADQNQTLDEVFEQLLKQLHLMDQSEERFEVMQAIADSALPDERKEYLIAREIGQIILGTRSQSSDAIVLDYQLSRIVALMNLYQQTSGELADSGIELFRSSFRMGSPLLRERFYSIYREEARRLQGRPSPIDE